MKIHLTQKAAGIFTTALILFFAAAGCGVQNVGLSSSESVSDASLTSSQAEILPDESAQTESLAEGVSQTGIISGGAVSQAKLKQSSSLEELPLIDENDWGEFPAASAAAKNSSSAVVASDVEAADSETDNYDLDGDGWDDRIFNPGYR
ncbi:MAG: hypothetical protein LBQ48_06490 [Oscillospiraceae bacterium]|nr:hypothetical protein [Oscillospiraceae bacterium]